jgi:hypothetical protein
MADDSTESVVTRLWRQRLREQVTSADDDFFDLGGESLDLVWFLGQVYDIYRVELAVTELFLTGFTVATTSRAIDAAVQEAAL